jgi:hypothetical protein
MYLYKIIIRKPFSLEDAIDIAHPFLSKNMKQVYYTETKNQYTFTNIKRKHFLSSTFDIRTNGRITIYISELRNFKKQHKMRGDGLLSYIYSGNWVNDYSSKAKKVLQQYGNETIQSITILKTPIRDVIEKAINIFSLGKWKKLKAKYGFDTFFHLGLISENNIRKEYYD